MNQKDRIEYKWEISIKGGFRFLVLDYGLYVRIFRLFHGDSYYWGEVSSLEDAKKLILEKIGA